MSLRLESLGAVIVGLIQGGGGLRASYRTVRNPLQRKQIGVRAAVQRHCLNLSALDDLAILRALQRPVIVLVERGLWATLPVRDAAYIRTSNNNPY